MYPRILCNLRFLLPVLILLLLVCPAQAQSQIGLSPAFMEATLKPGSVYTQDFTISNKTSTRVRMRAYVRDFWYDENNQRLEGLPGTHPHSAAPWIQFAPDEMIVEPESAVKFKAVITIPNSAAGGYYAVPYFEGVAADEPAFVGKRQVQAVGVRLGGLLLFATDPGSQYNVRIARGALEPPTATTPLAIALDVANMSNAHVILRGTLVLLDSAGRIAGRGQIEEQRYLPGQRFLLRALWRGELAPGKYTAIVSLTYQRAGMEPATLACRMPFDVKSNSNPASVAMLRVNPRASRGACLSR